MSSTGWGVRLEPWGEGDFWLLRRATTPAMTEYLGGPETEEKLAARHRRYVELRGPGRMYRVVLTEAGATAGSIGFWEHAWQDTTVWETGWAVLPEYQGRGVGARAASAVAQRAREAGRHRYLHAFPDVAHSASNAVCRRAGFELLGEVAFEYPKGRWIRSHDWRLDLEAGCPHPDGRRIGPRPARVRPPHGARRGSTGACGGSVHSARRTPSAGTSGKAAGEATRGGHTGGGPEMITRGATKWLDRWIPGPFPAPW